MNKRLPLNCNNLRMLLVYSRHIDSRVFWGHLRLTYCQHSFHRQTLLLVGSHAASPPFGTVFPHLYALLTVSLVLGLSSRLTCSQDICSRFAARCPRLWYSFIPCLSRVINSLIIYLLIYTSIICNKTRGLYVTAAIWPSIYLSWT